MKRFGLVTFVDAPGRPDLVVEIADDHARGLQGRTWMDPDRGMLFTWPIAAVREFWMRDVLIPLDVIFVEPRGRIVMIWQNLAPGSDAPRSSLSPASHAIEVNGGYCRSRVVAIGQRVRIGA